MRFLAKLDGWLTSLNHPMVTPASAGCSVSKTASLRYHKDEDEIMDNIVHTEYKPFIHVRFPYPIPLPITALAAPMASPTA